MAGQVIGINTAIITGSRGYEGVGFALPSTTAINVYNQLIKNGRVTRGSIGVSFQEELGTNPITLKSLGAPYGVVIEGVEPGSPAEKAGLKGGDVITAVNGTAVKTGNDLVNPIAAAPIGSKVKITYYRDKQMKETTATVEDRTRVFPNTQGRVSSTPEDNAPAEFGLHVESLTPDRAQRVGIEGQKGVVVSEIEPASICRRHRFSAGRRHLRSQRTGSHNRRGISQGSLQPEAGTERGVQGSATEWRPGDDHVPPGCGTGRK